jgi:hypothetical protein
MKKIQMMLIAVAIVLLPQSQLLAGNNKSPRIAPIQSQPYGRSYGEWATAWWQWAVAQPFEGHPLFDFLSPADCDVKQHGRVWFLGGTFASMPGIVRECVVPAGTALFFPIINAAWFGFAEDPPEQKTEQFIRAQVACGDYKVRAKIDGVRVKHIRRYFVQSPIFEAPAPDGNIITGVEQILAPNVDQGFYLMLRPLSVGEHTVQFRGSQSCPFGDFEDGATYRIRVVPRRHEDG